jgi:hypothetical protein
MESSSSGLVDSIRYVTLFFEKVTVYVLPSVSFPSVPGIIISLPTSLSSTNSASERAQSNLSSLT